MPEVGFRLRTARSGRPLVFRSGRPSACTKAALILCFHSWSCIISLLLWVSALKKKKKERKRKKHGTKSNVRPLLSPHRHTSEEIWAVSQSLLKSYISPPIMYIKRLFSLPQWRRLFSQSCLSVPELVTYCVSTFPFLPLISASSFAGVVLIRTQHSTLQWRLCPWKGVFIRHKRFVKKQWKKKETLNVCIIKGESRCRERKE